MMRVVSVLLILAGLLLAGLGAASLMTRIDPPRASKTASENAELPAAPAGDPPADTAAAPTATEEVPAPSAPLGSSAPTASAPDEADRAVALESLPTDRNDTGEMGIEAELGEEMGFMFQTQDAETVMPPPPAPAASQPMSGSPSLMDRLKTVPVAHETPREAEYKRAFDVTFAIDATGDATAADALPGDGMIETGEARVTEEVEVRLSGANFLIEAASPPVQALSPLTENTWRWSVTPLSAGEHDLVFEVFAIEQGRITPLRTYRDTVSVKVSGLNRAIAFADQTNPLFVLLGGLGSMIAGFLGAVKFFRKG